MLKLYWRYLISYNHENGSGFMYTNRRKPFTQKVVEETVEWLMDERGYKQVVIIAITKLNRVTKNGE